MARIVYGVMGDSRGHLSRSLAVARELSRHEILFVGGGTVRELEREGYAVIETPVPATQLSRGQVDVTATVAHTLKIIPAMPRALRRIESEIRSFSPNLVISDYEPFTQVAARRLGIPCVSLDHPHILTHCRCEHPPVPQSGRFITSLFMKGVYSHAGRYLISSFFWYPPLDDAITEILPPVIQRDVQGLAATEGGHATVYLRGGLLGDLLEALKGLDGLFYIYGAGAKPTEQNLIFRETSRHSFLRDMASSRYIICNGGHSTISEALYLGKPVLSLPVHLFYEQLLNAHALDVTGYGAYCLDPQRYRSALCTFEARLDEYRTQIKQGRFWGNDLVAARVEELLA